MKQLLLLTTLISCANTHAFDDDRKGLILGVGVGVSQLQMEYAGGREWDTGVAASLKIGYGVNETYQVYFVHNASWMPYAGEIFADGITGIGVDVYINKNSFFSVAAGAGVSTPITIDANSFKGSAFSISVGRELKPHHSLQLYFVSTDVDVPDDAIDDDFQTKAIQAMYSYTFY